MKEYGLEAVSIRLVKGTPLLSDTPVTTPMAAVKLLGEELCQYDREVICVINLRTDGTPINYNVVSVGSLSASVMHQREMLKSSILSNAASIIMIHNHPSGNLKPSREDTMITDKMLKACDMIGIRLLDHIIVGGENQDYFSFEEGDLLEFDSPGCETDYRNLSWPQAAVAEEQPEFSVNDSCPYCQIKAAAGTKTVFETLAPKDGICPDCGAYIDVGQLKVKMNGYADIYKGTVRLLGEMVDQFNELLSYCDVNFEDCLSDDEDGKVRVSMRASEIIEQLFVPYVGSTTKCNLKKALGIKEDWLNWTVFGKDDDEQDM